MILLADELTADSHDRCCNSMWGMVCVLDGQLERHEMVAHFSSDLASCSFAVARNDCMFTCSQIEANDMPCHALLVYIVTCQKPCIITCLCELTSLTRSVNGISDSAPRIETLLAMVGASVSNIKLHTHTHQTEAFKSSQCLRLCVHSPFVHNLVHC